MLLTLRRMSGAHSKRRTEPFVTLGCRACPSPVTLKISPRGTQFFAHKAVGACKTAPETEAHLRLKRMAVLTARAIGWDALTEAFGSSPTGEAWKADVLARKGKQKVAVEIQWSNQTAEETIRRQELYARSGVRGLWLFRHSGFPVDQRQVIEEQGDQLDGWAVYQEHELPRRAAVGNATGCTNFAVGHLFAPSTQ